MLLVGLHELAMVLPPRVMGERDKSYRSPGREPQQPAIAAVSWAALCVPEQCVDNRAESFCLVSEKIAGSLFAAPSFCVPSAVNGRGRVETLP